MGQANQPHDIHHFKNWDMTREEFMAKFMNRAAFALPLPEALIEKVVIGDVLHEDGSGQSFIANSGRYELYVRFSGNRERGARGYVRIYHDAPQPVGS